MAPLGEPGEPETASGAPFGQLPCGATTQAGRPCGRFVGARLTPEGWRCRNHRPKAPPGEVRPIESPADAMEAIAWAVAAARAGLASAPVAQAVITGATKWLDAWKDAEDHDRRVKALTKQLADLKAAYEKDEHRRRRDWEEPGGTAEPA